MLQKAARRAFTTLPKEHLAEGLLRGHCDPQVGIARSPPDGPSGSVALGTGVGQSATADCPTDPQVAGRILQWWIRCKFKGGH